MTAPEQAVVVGATGAIGQAVIQRLTRRGLPVLAVARGKDSLDELAAAYELVTPCPADIGSNDAIGAIGAALTGTVRIAVFAAGLRLGALTNDMTAFHGSEWVARQQHLKLFDVIVDASLTGVMKPDPAAFRGATEALGLPAEQIVFLDDMPWNVEGARQAGMTAIRVHWDDPGPALDTARNLLGLGSR